MAPPRPGDGVSEQLDDWYDFERPEEEAPPDEFGAFLKIGGAILLVAYGLLKLR